MLDPHGLDDPAHLPSGIAARLGWHAVQLPLRRPPGGAFSKRRPCGLGPQRAAYPTPLSFFREFNHLTSFNP